MYAILRAAFMSDEPVRGAPSIDAFSVEKVENEVRHPPVSPRSLSFFRSHVSFRVPSSAWTAFDGGTRDSAADSICARATRDERIYDLPVIFVGQGLPFRIAIYLRIAGAYVSDFRGGPAAPASDMAQTYNQKRNVYSIDQILGHAKDEGTAKCLRFSFSRNARKLFVRVDLRHIQAPYVD